MKQIKLDVPGLPVARHSPGFNRGTGIVYKNSADRIWQSHVRTYAITNRPAILPLNPVQLIIIFKLKRPKALKTNEFFHTKKPDLDNLIKLIKDAMTQSMYKDDAQVFNENLLKVYDEKPGVTIILNYFEKEDYLNFMKTHAINIV